MTAMRLKRYPSSSGGFALGKVGVGATMLKQGKTARDYVQDGLVAMWDGIENAGWGVHDPNATVWNDLAGNNNFTIDSLYGYFSDKSFVTTDVRFKSAEANYPDASFFEIVIKNPTANTQFVAVALKKPYGACIYRNSGRGVTLYTATSGCARDLMFNDGKAHTLSIDYDSGSKPTVYIDGIVRNYKVGGSWSSDFIMPNNMQIGGLYANAERVDTYALRAYKESPTADEIAANYAIDKERFNLP